MTAISTVHNEAMDTRINGLTPSRGIVSTHLLLRFREYDRTQHGSSTDIQACHGSNKVTV
jgi:hypothetical protein